MNIIPYTEITETPDNMLQHPTGDGGYGHAQRNLEHQQGLTREAEELGVLTDDYADELASRYIEKHGIAFLVQPDVLSKYALGVQAAIIRRASQTSES